MFIDFSTGVLPNFPNHGSRMAGWQEVEGESPLL